MKVFKQFSIPNIDSHQDKEGFLCMDLSQSALNIYKCLAIIQSLIVVAALTFLFSPFNACSDLWTLLKLQVPGFQHKLLIHPPSSEWTNSTESSFKSLLSAAREWGEFKKGRQKALKGLLLRSPAYFDLCKNCTTLTSLCSFSHKLDTVSADSGMIPGLH